MTRPDAVCPNRASHTQIEVAYADADDRTIHWHCNTPVVTDAAAPRRVCGAEWVTPWRDDHTHTDEALEGHVRQFDRSLTVARDALRDAMLKVERQAHEAAEADEPTLTEKFYAAVRKVERCERRVESAREDLRVWRIQRDMQLSRRDTQSSASRQHYVLTGNYLDIGEAATVDG